MTLMNPEKWHLLTQNYRQAQSQIEEARQVLELSLNLSEEQASTKARPISILSKALLQNGESIYNLTKQANALIADIGEALITEIVLDDLRKDQAA